MKKINLLFGNQIVNFYKYKNNNLLCNFFSYHCNNRKYYTYYILVKVRNILFTRCKRMKKKYKRLYQYVSKKKNEIYWSKKIVNEVLDIFRIPKDVIKYHIEPFI